MRECIPGFGTKNAHPASNHAHSRETGLGSSMGTSGESGVGPSPGGCYTALWRPLGVKKSQAGSFTGPARITLAAMNQALRRAKPSPHGSHWRRAVAYLPGPHLSNGLCPSRPPQSNPVGNWITLPDGRKFLETGLRFNDLFGHRLCHPRRTGREITISPVFGDHGRRPRFGEGQLTTPCSSGQIATASFVGAGGYSNEDESARQKGPTQPRHAANRRFVSKQCRAEPNQEPRTVEHQMRARTLSPDFVTNLA